MALTTNDLKREVLRRDARIRELEAALAPFAAIADLVDHTPQRDGEVVYRLPKPEGGYWELERKHFRSARAAIELKS